MNIFIQFSGLRVCVFVCLSVCVWVENVCVWTIACMRVWVTVFVSMCLKMCLYVCLKMCECVSLNAPVGGGWPPSCNLSPASDYITKPCSSNTFYDLEYNQYISCRTSFDFNFIQSHLGKGTTNANKGKGTGHESKWRWILRFAISKHHDAAVLRLSHFETRGQSSHQGFSGS